MFETVCEDELLWLSCLSALVVWVGGMPLDRGRKKNPTSDRMLRWTGSILARSVHTDITSEYHVALFIFGEEHRWTDCDNSDCDSSASLETAWCPGHSFEKEALSGVATLWLLIQNKDDVRLHNFESCNACDIAIVIKTWDYCTCNCDCCWGFAIEILIFAVVIIILIYQQQSKLQVKYIEPCDCDCW